MMSMEEQREMDRLKAVVEGLKIQLSKKDAQIESMNEKYLNAIRVIGAIVIQNGGTVEIDPSSWMDTRRKSIMTYEDLTTLKTVIRILEPSYES